MNGNNGWSRGLKVATILAVAWLLIWGIFAVGTALATPASPDEPTTPTGTGAPETESLVVTPDDLLPEQALCTSDVFLDHSLRKVKKGSDEHRWWSDAVSIPFQASAKGDALKELFAENCGNPTELAMNVEALSAFTPINGFNVGDHNSWMAEFLTQADELGLRSAFLTKKDGVEGIFVTAEYQHVAAMTNTLLLAFENKGFVKEKSLTNRHIADITAGELPRATLNPKQEKLKVLRLEFTAKDQGCLAAIGFNKHDKRFETLPCKKPKPNPTPTATPTKPGFKPTPKPSPTPTKPTKTPKPSPTPTPTPTPETKKPSEHPANQGNAPSPSVPAPPVTEPASSPSVKPSATYSPAPAPEPTKVRTTQPTQPAPPKATASASIDPCKGPDAASNPACG